MDDMLGLNLGRRASQTAEKVVRRKAQTKTARIKARKSYLSKATRGAWDEFTVVDLQLLFIDLHFVRHGAAGSPGSRPRFNAVFAEIIENYGARHAARLVMAAFTLQDTPDGVAWFQNPKNINPLSKNLDKLVGGFKIPTGLGEKYSEYVHGEAMRLGVIDAA